jgi:hypothetical protein
MVDILETAQETLNVSSCGKQAEAIKRSMPEWTLPKAGRHDAQKLGHIAPKGLDQDLLGRDSPGFAYDPKRQRELPKWHMGTAAQRPPAAPNKFPETYNDLIGNIPDSQFAKYKSVKVGFGVAARDAPSNNPDCCGFPTGRLSPGPQRYKPEKGNGQYSIRLAHAPHIDHIPPKFSLRSRTRLIEGISQTGEKVGPGTYPLPPACGEQPTSTKQSLPLWNICKQDRFIPKREHQPANLWADGDKAQKEKNCRTFNSSPSWSMGRSTRQQAQRLARCTTNLDLGPVGQMEKPWKSHPSIVPRRQIVKFT